MDINLQKEKFSEAYVRAVAAAAGYGVSRPEIDDDSVDLTIAARGGNGSVRSPRLDIQLKCTSSVCLNDESFSFPVSLKNYDDLREERVMTPRILVVVRVPEASQDWIAITEDQLLLRYCGYWVSLCGQPYTGNVANKTVTIPRRHLFTVDGLRMLMTRIGTGGKP